MLPELLRRRRIWTAITPLVTASIVHLACSSPPPPKALSAQSDGLGDPPQPAPPLRRRTSPGAFKALSSPLYYVDFNNNTPQTWTMVVFQTLPHATNMDSVSWKQATAPPSGSRGVSWALKYNVVLADYTQSGGIGFYKASQTLDAPLGTAWQVVVKDNVPQLLPTSITTGGQLRIVNESGLLVNVGVGVDGQGSAYQRGVFSNVAVQFIMNPTTYWVGLFEQTKLGQVVSAQVAKLGPWELQFPTGQNQATVTASIDGETINVEVTYAPAAIALGRALAPPAESARPPSTSR